MIYVAANDREAIDPANAILAAIVKADERPFVVASLLIYAAGALASRSCGEIERAEIAADMRAAADALKARVQ